jgi:hypothetical protein
MLFEADAPRPGTGRTVTLWANGSRQTIGLILHEQLNGIDVVLWCPAALGHRLRPERRLREGDLRRRHHLTRPLTRILTFTRP